MPTSETPERMTITDLQADESITVQFNPKELKRKLAANYAMKEVLGNSHQEHEYLNTVTQELTFDLFSLVETPEQLAQSEDAMKFLESLLYAPANPDSIASGAPPRVLIVWPNTLSLTCRLGAIEFTHQRFNRHGHTTQWTARTTWTQALLRRITKQDVRTHGARRTPNSTVDDTGSDDQAGIPLPDVDADIEITF
jgi:hypothetical protein